MIQKRIHRIPNCLTLRDAHREYLKTIKRGTQYDVPQGVYAGICRALNERMMESVITGDLLEVRIAPYLGKIKTWKRMTPCDPKHMRIDWGRTKKLGALIFHENEHTKGYHCLIKWHPSHKMSPNRYYRFEPLRRHTSTMSTLFRNGQVDYPVYDAKKIRQYKRNNRRALQGLRSGSGTELD